MPPARRRVRSLLPLAALAVAVAGVLPVPAAAALPGVPPELVELCSPPAPPTAELLPLPAAGCGPALFGAARNPPAPPTGCAVTAREPAELARVLAAAVPGQRLCLLGAGLVDAPVTVTTSGTAQAPLEIVGDGSTPVRSVAVAADHVLVVGLVIEGGTGLDLAGAGLVARANTVRGAADDGIVCVPCSDATIEDNTVTGSDNTGIRVEGARIAVRANTVSGSVVRDAAGGTDADGIRFFGNGISISRNLVADLKDDAVPGAEPHTDCFQTFDDASPTTFDVVIWANYCTNVDHQCLVATADERGNAGVPAGTTAIRFVGNYCDVLGSQPVFLDDYPFVEVRNNTLWGDNAFRAVLAVEGATHTVVAENVSPQGVPAVEADAASLEGLQIEGNLTAAVRPTWIGTRPIGPPPQA